ncbi:hypothetical protein D1AOALGA4SA_1846 [Olavius algarvensis Delta 1 endosymbiont]|nr:hypothetical protein D1AOALGA4SA_1846 [Olavius algarvensis Delta 1 endosymbiont]
MKNEPVTKQYIHHTRGVCPAEIHFKISNDRINDLRFVGGGCPGNAQLVSRLLEDKSLAEVLNCLDDIGCRNGTSCPAELARALQAVQNGALAAVDSVKIQEDRAPRRSIALIGSPAGDNAILQNILKHARECKVDAVVCLGDLTGRSPHNRNLIKTIRREKISALPGETDWRTSQIPETPELPDLGPKLKDWLFQLPQVLSFRLNNRKGMAFFGNYIQFLAGYSDFQPFALEINMVCGLTDFMRDETVFPALEAMIPQFQADVIVFGQPKTWGSWHVGGKYFFSVGAAAQASGAAWGLLSEKNGQADLKIMHTPA